MLARFAGLSVPRAVVRTAAAVAALAAVSLSSTEVVVRIVARRDADGQEWFRDLRLRPYRLPLGRIAATLSQLEHGDSFVGYDAELGWSPRPFARSLDGMRRVDGAGIRGDDTRPLVAPPGVLRIALFGDSFTFGDEVRLDDTWGAVLERELEAAGVPAEVLNFGVVAYGMDQAYLRWLKGGRAYHPDVVIYGFQPENVLRNLNVFRALYFEGTELPLSKPRFVLRDGVLALVNVPTIPPPRLLHTLATLERHPLREHERFFAPMYETHPWLHSRLAALASAEVVRRRLDRFQVDGETHDLAARILADFAADVTASGAAFVVVHLPRRDDLVARHAVRPLWYGDLLREIDERFAMIHPETAFPGDGAALFASHGHYGPVLHRAVGEALVDPVRQAAEERRIVGR
jgi:hypothetical protein